MYISYVYAFKKYNIYTHTYIITHTHSHTLTHTRTHTQTHTRTHTHTHTHLRYYSYFPICNKSAYIRELIEDITKIHSLKLKRSIFIAVIYISFIAVIYISL